MDNNYWTLIDYFDVWGNEEDGWEVNDQSIEFDDLYLDPYITEEELVEYLKSIGYFASNVTMTDLEIENGGDYIEFFQASNMMPLCRLDRNWR